MTDQKNRQQEKELLKEYLNQYRNCRIKRVQLERRLRNLCEEMKAPIGGRGYSPVNYGGTNRVGAGAASFVYRMGEIETRIEEQKSRVEKSLLKVMDLMDFLEENSAERMILEMRFIDCKNWEQIGIEAHLSRRACFKYQSRALDNLLGFKKVCKILEEYGRRKSEI